MEHRDEPREWTMLATDLDGGPLVEIRGTGERPVAMAVSRRAHGAEERDRIGALLSARYGP